MATAKAIEIKIALLKLGVKQVDVARALKVSRMSVCDVIRGKTTSRRIMSHLEEIIKKAS